MNMHFMMIIFLHSTRLHLFFQIIADVDRWVVSSFALFLLHICGHPSSPIFLKLRIDRILPFYVFMKSFLLVQWEIRIGSFSQVLNLVKCLQPNIYHLQTLLWFLAPWVHSIYALASHSLTIVDGIYFFPLDHIFYVFELF